MGSREPRDLSRYLDGEMSKADLPEDLRREAERFERMLAAIPRPASRLPRSITSSVMEQVRATRAPAWQRWWSWAATPRTVRVSPLAGLLAAAAVAGLLLVIRPAIPPSAPVVATRAESVPVRFTFVAPGAARVAVTGEFAQWSPDGVPMKDNGDGTWVAEIDLPAGLHHYAFVVDGNRWAPDPNATAQVDDGFGRQNSVLLVTRHSS